MAKELSWRTLNERLPDMTERQVRELLDAERARDGGPRSTILTRLHQRYTALRAARERKELMAAGS